MPNKEKDLDKLGVVLAVTNEVMREQLNMLKEQQKRQVRMIWSSLGIVAMAITVVGMAIYMTFSSLDRLTEQMERWHGGVMIERQSDTSQRLH